MSVRKVPVLDGIDAGTLGSRYDRYLALLPLPLLLGVLASVPTGLPAAYGAGLGSLPSALLLGHVLFRDAPTAAVERSGRAGRDGHGVPADD